MLLIGVAALMATFAMPIARWRTGEIRVPPLSLLPAGAAPQAGARIWVDTDAACGVNDRIDPDDCFALLALAHARNLRIAGISTVFGNAELDETDAITRELVAQLSQEGFALPAVHRGSAAAIDRSDALSPSLAVSALRAALEKESLTIVALGPLTNIALAL